MSILDRAQGCFLGQIAGDSLGSLVEFKTPSKILELYPKGVKELHNGGTFNTLAGQPTDDSEMALMLARTLIKEKRYQHVIMFNKYREWYDSEPFDCGFTISGALLGQKNYESQANGALMRISPLGIFGVNYSLQEVSQWAVSDCNLTHPNVICQQINSLFTKAITVAIRDNYSPKDLYKQIKEWAVESSVRYQVMDVIELAAKENISDFMQNMGWVLIAFQNALYQLLHAETLEMGVIDTVMKGGDTDTNAAITGALLGAVYGRSAVPAQWEKSVLACKPQQGNSSVHQPRPEIFWPTDILELSEQLISKE